jgi:hypothetical protein
MSGDNVVIGSIIVTGKGSAHPKLGVKKKNDLETNTQILDDMITSGKLALDHALARTRKGGALRGHFGCRTDAAMDAHVDALHAFLVAWKRRLVPDWDPAAPAPAPAPKPFEPHPPVMEAAKSGKAACRQCGGLIPAGELRCGLSAYMKGTVAVTWSHAGCFPVCLSFQAGSTDDIDLRDKTSVNSRKNRCVRWW